MEAEMAFQFLAPLPGAARREFRVSGNLLAPRLTAEGPGGLQIAVASRLDQLALLAQATHRFVPPFFARPQAGKGA
ncbi:Cancer/testis antigen 1 [Fukomys damarensis]|uniref:Cancer/testis antigen 1 n=1 Tax=Fukomys damarensis TaxID=885580 RepID=A0A091DRG0_FUKDA|nr:Cancer/testis antigen 1 [Fukomys damarensis]